MTGVQTLLVRSLCNMEETAREDHRQSIDLYVLRPLEVSITKADLKATFVPFPKGDTPVRELYGPLSTLNSSLICSATYLGCEQAKRDAPSPASEMHDLGGEGTHSPAAQLHDLTLDDLLDMQTDTFPLLLGEKVR